MILLAQDGDRRFCAQRRRRGSPGGRARYDGTAFLQHAYKGFGKARCHYLAVQVDWRKRKEQRSVNQITRIVVASSFVVDTSKHFTPEIRLFEVRKDLALSRNRPGSTHRMAELSLRPLVGLDQASARYPTSLTLAPGKYLSVRHMSHL